MKHFVNIRKICDQIFIQSIAISIKYGNLFFRINILR